MLCFEKKIGQKKLRLSGMICRFFDNCINECYIVGDGSPVPTHRLYRYTRRDLSSFSLPLRGRGTATRWKEFYATLSFRHFLAKMPPPSMREANKPSSRRCLQTLTHLQIPPVSATPANACAFANPSRNLVFIDIQGEIYRLLASLPEGGGPQRGGRSLS